jgi:tRNA modification GTPase
VLSDAIVALATLPGRSALALIRLSGRGAFDIGAKVLHPFHSDRPRVAVRVAVRHPTTGEDLDLGIAICYPGPASYTGEDQVEIATHGGLLVPGEVVAACVAAGARLAEPGEFTRRALQNGKLDLVQAEATADLIEAGAPAQRRRALQQLERGLSRRLEALREEILQLEALIAYDIDFPEEDEGPVRPEQVERAWHVVHDRLARLLATAPEGERLHERAIVTEIPGTTRDAIEAPAVLEGFPFRLVDTAGLRDSPDRVERLGIEVSRRYLANADLVLFCEEAGSSSATAATFLSEIKTPVIAVATKADLQPPTVQPPDRQSVAVSTVTGVGLDTVKRKLAEAAFGSLVRLGDVEPIVTRERHRAALAEALRELEQFQTARARGVDAAATATHLVAAVGALDDLIGVVTPDDVLDRVFGSFCVGK